MSLQRYILIPDDISIVDLATEAPLLIGEAMVPWKVSFKDFVCGTFLKDARVGKTVESVFLGADIRAAVRDAMKSDPKVLSLAEDAYALLCEILRTPEGGYRAELAVQLVPFARAILDATTTDPR